MSGEKFKIEDQYTEPRAARLMLEHAWLGTTEFQEVAKPSDNDKNHEGKTKSSEWAEMASHEESEMLESEVKGPDPSSRSRYALSYLGRSEGRGRQARTKSALSLRARASGWIEGGC